MNNFSVPLGINKNAAAMRKMLSIRGAHHWKRSSVHLLPPQRHVYCSVLFFVTSKRDALPIPVLRDPKPQSDFAIRFGQCQVNRSAFGRIGDPSGIRELQFLHPVQLLFDWDCWREQAWVLKNSISQNWSKNSCARKPYKRLS